ncbi:hypothetical protein PIB30_071136, partial [Stylosanthes scabra]|nr:hypothetical protein [Stylosanthes scabra]
MGNAPRQPNFDPYSKTFNPGRRNNPNFGWGGQGNQGEMCYNNNFQQPTLQLPTSPIHPFVSQKLSQLEEALQKLTLSTTTFIDSTTNFMNETRANFKNQEASIRNLEVQVSQIEKQLSERPPNTFPSNTVPNPREE